MAYIKTEIVQKYDGIDAGGKAACAEGSIKQFGGFPPTLAQRFNTAFFADAPSYGLLRERLIGPLQRRAESLGITLMLASLDYPYHVTLQEGVETDPPSAAEGIAEIFQTLQQKVEPIVGRFSGQTFAFNRLLMDKGGNLMLASTEISEGVFSARAEISALFGEHGMKPQPIDNILHSTIVRLKDLPADRASVMREFRPEVECLQALVATEPLTFTVGGYYSGDALSLLSR